jgi:hypothetical protein
MKQMGEVMVSHSSTNTVNVLHYSELDSGSGRLESRCLDSRKHSVIFVLLCWGVSVV